MAKKITTIKSTDLNRERLALTSLKIKNVKSVANATLNLKPLTLIIGANSSGKSTALQALMLIAQNYSFGQNFIWALNGQSANFGQFEHFSKRGSSGKVEIGVEFTSEDRFQAEKRFNLFSTYTLIPDSGNKQSSNALLAAYDLEIEDISAGMRFGAKAIPNLELSMSNTFVSDIYANLPRTGSSGEKRRSARNSHFFGINKGRMASDLLPSGLASGMPIWQLIMGLQRLVQLRSSIAAQSSKSDRETGNVAEAPKRDARERSIASGALAKGLDLLGKSLSELKKGQMLLLEEEVAFLIMRSLGAAAFATGDGLERLLSDFRKLPAYSWLDDEVQVDSDSIVSRTGRPDANQSWMQVSAHSRNIGSFFKNSIHYLGPLRSLDGLASSGAYFESRNVPVGRNGELLASALQMHLNEIAIYPLPNGEVECEFGYALDKWLHWFELGTGLDLPEDGFSRRVTISGEYFFQVGTGVSQVVPVIALALLARANSTVLIEQPELHLHPKLQQRLADFFLAMIKSGRRFVLETHSEYIVNRVRARVSSRDASSQDMALYFATRNSKGSSVYNLAEMTDGGLLNNWPTDFFDLTAEDAITIAENN